MESKEVTMGTIKEFMEEFNNYKWCQQPGDQWFGGTFIEDPLRRHCYHHDQSYSNCLNFQRESVEIIRQFFQGKN